MSEPTSDLGLSPESIELFSDNPTPVPSNDTPAPQDAPTPEPDGAPAASPPGEGTPSQGALNAYWKKFEADVKAVDPDYQLPLALQTRKNDDGTDLTLDQEFELFRLELLDYTENPYEQDPLVQSYVQAKETEGFDQSKWILDQAKAYTFLSAPSKDIVLQAYRITNEKEGRNWTEENIQSFVDGMNPIDLDLKADAIREAYQGNMGEATRAQQKDREIQYNKYVEDTSKANIEMAKSVYPEMDKISSIGGVPHSENDRAEFRKSYEELITINPKTGDPYVMELLADNNTLYKAMYLLHAADKGLISNFKEDFKKEVLDKTGIKRTQEMGGSVNLPREMQSEDYI